MQFPTERNVGCSIGFECHFTLAYMEEQMYVRTDVQSDGSAIITYQKFLAFMHFLISLTHGAPRSALPGALLSV